MSASGMELTPKTIGSPIKRREDPVLITGGATYVDDIVLPDLHYMALVRSPYAHAHIREIDISRARALPGVVAVLTHDDVKHLGPLPVASRPEGMPASTRHALTGDKVRHVGEPVAAVVATSRYGARDAALAARVEYEPLPPIVDVEEAVRTGAPLVHDELGTNVGTTLLTREGDIEAAFRAAHRVVRAHLVNQRVMALPMETRGSVALWDAGRRHMTLWTSTQFPHVLRNRLAPLFGLTESQLRVVAPEVGGGFGVKAEIHPDDVLVLFAAQALRKPVKYVEDRAENFVQTGHGRGQVDVVEAAVKNDGTLLGLRLTIYGDLGAYSSFAGAVVPTLTRDMATGPYKVRNLAVDTKLVYTNKTPTSTYRGAGRPEATYLLERTMDIIAYDLGLDPVEVRRRNLLDPDQFPYTSPTDSHYDTGNYQAALDRALEVIDYDGFRAEQAYLREQGRYVGLGLSTYVEACGPGPSVDMEDLGGGWESATVRVERSGRVTLLTGASPHGQGAATAYAQIVADSIGVSVQDVEVIHGDTDRVQEGMGTFGSRNIAVGGSAVVHASGRIRDKALHIAAAMLEVSPDDMVFQDGRYRVRGVPDRSASLAEIAARAYYPVGLPPELEPGLEAQFFFEPTSMTFPFGTHVAIVEVESDTGKVTLQRIVAVDDCGNVVNPLLRDGQIHGGIAQAAAQALFEEVVYDETGQLLTGTLMDYAAPKADDLPSFELYATITPTPNNPLGAKGVGEAGSIGSTPAIVNAVLDALRPFGVRHLDMPLKPEKVWRAMQEAAR
jgi:carbon-monoxide dehydrogenase large subunit